MSVTFTTTLPDAEQPSLGNGVEDEIAVSWPDTIDNGQYHAEYRETGASAWLDGFTVDSSVTSTPITGLEDGEEYEVRLRTQTDHATGDWTEPVSIVTEFPGLTDFAVVSTGATAVTLEAADHADNDDGVRVQRRQQYGSSWGDWAVVADTGAIAGTGSFQVTDDSPRPGRTYQYRLEQYTEHTSYTTAAVETTTDSLGLQRRPTEPVDWDARVLRSSGGEFSPTITGDPEWVPRVNALPRVRVTVEKSRRWMTSEYEGQPMMVWKDGGLLCIDELEVVRRMEDRVVLEGRGGLELLGKTAASFRDVFAHDAAKQIVQSDTPCATDVDDPASSTQTDALIQQADSEEELQNQIDGAFADDEPAEFADSGAVPLQKVAWFREGEANPDAFGGAVVANSDFSNVRALEVFGDRGGYLGFSFTPSYDVPASAITAAACWRMPNGGHDGFEVVIDGGQYNDEVFQEVLADALTTNTITWYDFFNSPSLDLQAGTEYQVRIQESGDDSTQTSNGVVQFDGVAVCDNRYSDPASWDTGVPDEEFITDPDLYPELSVETQTVTTTRNVTSIEFTAGVSSADGLVQIELSPDGGETWPVSGTGTTVSGEFETTTTSVKARVTLGPYGERDDPAPTTGYLGGELQSFEVRADLDDTPVLGNRVFEDTTLGVLQEIADYANAVFEVRRINGETTVVWTQPGQRDGELPQDIAEFEYEKNGRDTAERVEVVGGSLRNRSEAFTASHGSWVSLEESRIVRGSEVVYDPSTDTQYERGEDYAMNYLDGEIRVEAAGDMSDNTEYEVDSRYKAQGVYEVPGASANPKTRVVNLPQLTTPASCDQAALYLTKELQEPRHSVVVTVSEASPELSLVENLALPEEVTGGADGITTASRVENKSSSVVLELGSRQRAEDMIGDLQSRLESLAGQA